MKSPGPLLAVVGLVLGVGLVGCGAGASACGPSSGHVATVVDGDTVALTSGVKIRYLLVDTPETTQGHSDCYGAQASDFNRALVLDQDVGLRYGETCTDRYGRTLAYLTVAGREVNTLLVERGYGCVLHIPPGGDARLDEFKALEQTARDDKRGVWGACNPVPCL